MFVNIM